MPRKEGRPKVRTTITIDPVILDWVHANIGEGKRFGSVSHAFGSGIRCLMDGKAR